MCYYFHTVNRYSHLTCTENHGQGQDNLADSGRLIYLPDLPAFGSIYLALSQYFGDLDLEAVNASLRLTLQGDLRVIQSVTNVPEAAGAGVREPKGQ